MQQHYISIIKDELTKSNKKIMSENVKYLLIRVMCYNIIVTHDYINFRLFVPVGLRKFVGYITSH